MHEDIVISHCHLDVLPFSAVNSNRKISKTSCLSQQTNSCWLAADVTSINLQILFMIKLQWLLHLDWNLVTDTWCKILLGNNMPSSGLKQLWLHVSKHALESWVFLIYCLLYIVWCIHLCLSCFDPRLSQSISSLDMQVCTSHSGNVWVSHQFLCGPLQPIVTYIILPLCVFLRHVCVSSEKQNASLIRKWCTTVYYWPFKGKKLTWPLR